MTKLRSKNIAFIGLGSIGAPLAKHLVDEGANVIVHNRSPQKQDAWLYENVAAKGAANPSAAVEGVQIVITCVGDDADLERVYLGSDGLVESLSEGVLVIDHTTASDRMAKLLSATLAKKNVHFLDAPVSGGSVGAQNRALSIMCGGAIETFEAAQPVLSVYGKNVVYIGPSGAGQLCKMVNQICIAGVLEGLAEGIGLAKRAGLDVHRVIDAIKGGAAGSWQMNNRASYMIDESYVAGFTASLMYKDLGLSLAAAQESGVDSPLVALVHSQYNRLLAAGLGVEDFTNLHRMVLGELD